MTDVQYQDYVDEVLRVLEHVEEQEGVTFNTDDDAIGERFREYADQRIQPDEAVRYITKEILRQGGIENTAQYIPTRAGNAGAGNEQLTVEEIVEPNRWIEFIGTVIELYDPSAEGMVHNGILADDTGTIRFTAWEDDDGNDPLDTDLEVGETYRFEPVVTNLFEQADQIELKLRDETEVDHLTGDDALDIDPETYTETVSGAIVDFQAPMGLVDRCPNTPECGRVLQEPDHCPDCGDIDADIDLRTKAVLDTGNDTFTIILDAEQTERHADLDLNEAQELVREHNSRSVVRQYIEAQLHGEYLHAHGRSHSRTFSVDQVELIEPPTIEALDGIADRLEQLP